MQALREADQPPPPEARRRAIQSFNGDLQNPAPADKSANAGDPREQQGRQENPAVRHGHHEKGEAVKWTNLNNDAEAGAVVNLAKEAVAQYEYIKALVRAGEFAPAAARLLDDGEPLKEENPQDSPQFKQAIAMEQRIFQSLDQVQTTPANFNIQRDVQYAFDSLGEGNEPHNVRMRGTVVLTFELEGSQEAEQELFQNHRGTRTVADDGTLIVVMKKVDGKWYWNPFGW